ncbi:MAG: sulfatase family protein [Actinomycetota bacterium]
MSSPVGSRLVLRRASLVLLASILIAGSCTAHDDDPTTPPAEKPNILLIVTDDQREMPLAPVMPRTQEWFGSQGTAFTRAFATTPRCCPARVSFLTGLYAHNHGIYGEDVLASELAAVEPSMIQRRLQESGYRTGLFGKYLNNWPNERDPANFDGWATTPLVKYSGAEWNVGGTTRVVAENSTTFIGDTSLAFVEAAEDDDEVPWFLHVGFMAPHLPSDVEGRYEDVPVPPLRRSAAMTERDRRDKPRFVARRALRTASQIRSKRDPQLRSLVAVDDQIDRLMTRFEVLGELENTIAVFISDNGFQWGEHSLFGKSVPYLGSVRIPLYLRWPGHLAPGAVDDRLVGGIDLAPTLLAAAGLEPVVEPDGFDLLDEGASRSRLLLEFQELPRGPTPTWRAFVTRSFQYIEYLDRTGRVAFREFYRLRTDPEQLVNVLRDGRPGNDPDVVALSATLRRLRGCSGATCPG